MMSAATSMLLGLQQLDRISQLRRPLIKLFCNRSFHLASHDLQLRKWTLRLHFLKPFIKKCDLGAFRYQLRKVRLLQKFGDRITATLDFDYSLGKFTLAEKNGCLGTRVHHEHVRTKLLKAPRK